MRSLTIIAAAAIAFAAPVAAQAPTSVQQMRDAVQAGDLTTARRAATVLADGTDPVVAAEALWLIASLDNADGRPMRAAASLDRVADNAAAYGDPVLQAKALIESTTIYATERRYALAAERVEQLRPLLRSPFLPADLKAEAQMRLHL